MNNIKVIQTQRHVEHAAPTVDLGLRGQTRTPQLDAVGQLASPGQACPLIPDLRA